MLTAYFDDSGTHDSSEVVIWAGLFGNPNQWALLDDYWAAALKLPCPGKEAITRFHMWDCDQSLGECLGWKRHETDFLASELTQIIIKCGIYGYGCAVWRKDYDELVKGEVRTVYGDAEGYCVRSCYVRSIDWAREHAPHDPSLAFVFDQRPHPIRQHDNQVIFSVFADTARESGKKPELSGLTFLSASKFRPLQAADLFAWEFYQHAKEILRGRAEPGEPNRRNFQHLIAGGRFECQVGTRTEIELLANVNGARAERTALLAGIWRNAIDAAASVEKAARASERAHRKG